MMMMKTCMCVCVSIYIIFWTKLGLFDLKTSHLIVPTVQTALSFGHFLTNVADGVQYFQDSERLTVCDITSHKVHTNSVSRQPKGILDLLNVFMNEGPEHKDVH